MNETVIACLIALATAPLAAQPASNSAAKTAPTVDEILSIKRVAAPEISPDGRLVAYTVRETNWDDNAYETEIWVTDASGTAGGGPRPRTSRRPT